MAAPWRVHKGPLGVFWWAVRRGSVDQVPFGSWRDAYRHARTEALKEMT